MMFFSRSVFFIGLTLTGWGLLGTSLYALEWKVKGDGLEARFLEKRTSIPGEKKFTRLPESVSGVSFRNQLNRKNIKNYLLSGAGLTVGDYDQNGLPDLFLVSQDGANQLWRQTKPWVFEDVTVKAGVEDKGHWGAGAAFADIDNDGDLDLYLCNKGAYDVIFLNEGDGTFERNDFGAGDASLRAPTMVAFSDYDRDGDLDVYRTETRLLSTKEMFNFQFEVVRNEQGEIVPAPKYSKDLMSLGGGFVEKGTYDHLYVNELEQTGGEVRYRDVTRKAGIHIAREHGLAAVWWDYNNDNAPDLYVSNDFQTPDHLYHNNGDGTFSDVSGKSFPYTSWNSMGSDFSDINNDGWFDYLSTDMSATTHFKAKANMGEMASSAWLLDNLEPRQYMRNAMHVNTGTGSFLDVAFYAGLDSTDWTWAGIFGDLDNDGLEDAFFTNGIERNVQDADLSKKMDEIKNKGGSWDEIQKVLLESPRYQEKNLAFQNRGEFEFKNVSDEWGVGDLSVSHGAVMCDLDRDGDLDLIVNNMNEPFGLYRNNSVSNHSILVSLRGKKSNTYGLGARVEVVLADGTILSRLMTSSRGYMSGVEPLVHVGLGKHNSVKKLTVIWPTGEKQIFESLDADVHYRVTEQNTKTPEKTAESHPLFAESPGHLGLDFKHRENDFNDFGAQPLLPNRLSRFGPALAIADINGDKKADVFTGGAAGQHGVLYVQGSAGKFVKHPCAALKVDASREDVAAAWFDADGDGDLDLYVVSGGASEPAGSSHYVDRLYLNDGAGNLESSKNALPAWSASGSCVEAADFDQDGDLDLFVGARCVPGRYPSIPGSALLRNDDGKFTKVSSPMDQVGMVTAAEWADLNKDGLPDLAVATEWGQVRVFENRSGVLVETTKEAELSSLTGWWTSLASGDLDGDGDIDLIAGNFGLNTKYKVDPEHLVCCGLW